MGGGMYNSDSDPILTNVTFSDNSGGYGGGIRNLEKQPDLDKRDFQLQLG